MLNDPIADMLTRVRNALMVKNLEVLIPHSRIKGEIARVLLEEGYVKSLNIEKDERGFPVIRLELKYFGPRRTRRPVITGLKRVSTPGRRVYAGSKEIPWVLSGMGIAILTTNQGVMTDQQARRKGIGGEVLCFVW